MFYQHIIEIAPLFIVSLCIFFAQCIRISNSLKPTDFYGTAVELIQHNNNDHQKSIDHHYNSAINYRLKKNLKLLDEKKENDDNEQKQNPTTVDVVNDLLKIDRNNLSIKQKVLLEKIVERVARLRGSLFNNDTNNNQPIDTDNNDEQQQKATDIIGRSNTNAYSTSTLITTTKYPTTNMNINYNEYNGNNNIQKQHLEQQHLFNTNQPTGTTVTDLPDITAAAIEKNPNYNKIDLNNGSNLIISSIMANYTDVLFGNISTLSIVDSLSADIIPQHDIYEGRHPAISPTLSDKVSCVII